MNAASEEARAPITGVRAHFDPVVPGIWWVRGTRGSNTYLIEAGAHLLLVDTGFAGNSDAILEAVRALPPTDGPRVLTHLLLTHAHPDHVGSAATLRARTGACVVAGAADCEASPDGGHRLRVASARRLPGPRWLWRRMASRGRTEPLAVDLALTGEVEVVPGIVAIPTPGHTPGSYCFLDVARSVAFVGDLVIVHRDGPTRPLQMANADDALYLQTLASFAARAPEVGCAGHGAPVLARFGAELRALAALPRRRLGSPALLLGRVLRLARFSRDIGRRR